MTLSGTITTEMRFISLYTHSAVVQWILTQVPQSLPKRKRDKVYTHVILLFATVAIVCTNQTNYGLLRRFLYIWNFKLICTMNPGITLNDKSVSHKDTYHTCIFKISL